jgi:hypothetical protein
MEASPDFKLTFRLFTRIVIFDNTLPPAYQAVSMTGEPVIF